MAEKTPTKTTEAKISAVAETKSVTERSLLDVVKELHGKGAEQRTSRLLYAAIKGKREGLQEFHEKLFQDLDGKGKDAITGFGALCSGTTVLHLVEAPTKTLIKVLRALVDAEGKALIMRGVKILSLTEDMPRMYKEWRFTRCQTDADDPKDMEVLQLAWGALKQMLQMGMDNPNSTQITEKTMTRYFPSTAKLARVLGSDDLCAPAEYLEIFDAPFDVELDTERVWPMPPLVPY